MRRLHGRLLVASSLVLALGAACHPIPQGDDPSGAPLSEYTGEVTTLFDDVIEPRAVGLDLDGKPDLRTDKVFHQRAQTADAVLRARVSTVTVLDQGPDPAFLVGFHTVDRLAGHASPGEDFNVRIDRTTPALGVLKSFEGRLVGRVFVLMVKSFVGPDGDRVVHFHAMADASDTLQGVKEAVMLDELR